MMTISLGLGHICQSFAFFVNFLYARSKTLDVLWYGVYPSVCPSVSHIMSAQYLDKFMSDSHGTW